ncbi:MAG TPA: hypothetical protein VLY24_26905 [Bryobacteraceae bacterium]|nr:hypothetical protein [Bryobacteraceae bacterium]
MKGKETRLLLLLFSLGTLAFAQTMTGLPANGINLIGNPASPAISNASSKAIFAVIIRSGTGSIDTVWFSALPIAPGTSRSVSSGRGYSGPQIALDSAVFEDGSFVGPDKSSIYPIMQRQIAAYVNTANTFLANPDRTAAWQQLNSQAWQQTADLSGGPIVAGEVFALRAAARTLLNERIRNGESAAEARAAKFSALGILNKN